MPRIKIEDLPVLKDLSAKEIKGIFGGALAGSVEGSLDPESGDYVEIDPIKDTQTELTGKITAFDTAKSSAIAFPDDG